ncbi:hypothetical protein EG329_012252 [Mollisiaceae sp. DMI_Dod_QoI]|nr:hypothetical protein EG329_012252 [Helotiales sp. DMI_Dod_QoI]
MIAKDSHFLWSTEIAIPQQQVPMLDGIFQIQKSILTVPLTLLIGIISIRFIIQLSENVPLVIESETISTYFSRLDTINRSISTTMSDSFPVRVGLARKDGDMICNDANEVFFLEHAEKITTRRALAQQLKDSFRKIEEDKKYDRVNVPDRCVWSPDYQVERLKVSWDPINSSGTSWAPGTTMAETEITDQNVVATLCSLKKSPPSTCALSVLLAHIPPKDLQGGY